MISFVAFVLFSAGVLFGWVLRTIYALMVRECHDNRHVVGTDMADAERDW